MLNYNRVICELTEIQAKCNYSMAKELDSPIHALIDARNEYMIRKYPNRKCYNCAYYEEEGCANIDKKFVFVDQETNKIAFCNAYTEARREEQNGKE